ncbi:MAG TPA: VOC family protein [Phenylobacterium sp.]|jgi:predicted 3-demethylubiquinone-9 3-methyltransferase (glyoxalase superfamily)|nr:VOC family protein [Phenylobacterium sp.]
MSKIHPFLWYDTQAEEAAKLYVSLFPNSRITAVARNTEAAPGPTGAVLTVEFELDGMKVVALNGGPHFKPTEAFSFTIECESQAEVDRYWNALLADGGEPSQCGWLKDRFGLSWQVTPTILPKLLTDPDRAKAGRAMAAMMTMAKIDIAAIEAAAAGEPVAG